MKEQYIQALIQMIFPDKKSVQELPVLLRGGCGQSTMTTSFSLSMGVAAVVAVIPPASAVLPSASVFNRRTTDPAGFVLLDPLIELFWLRLRCIAASLPELK